MGKFIDFIKDIISNTKDFFKNYIMFNIEIEDGLYVRKLEPYISRESNNVIVIIPGGPRWAKNGAVVHASMISYNIKDAHIYIIGHDGFINFYGMNVTNKIQKSLEYINNKHTDCKIHCVGISVGGVALSCYLAYGYDQADYYYSVCSSIDLEDFYNGICEIFWLNIYMKSMIKIMERENVKVWNVNHLIPYMKFLRIKERLQNRNLENLTVIYGSEDPCSNNTEKHYKGCNPKIIEVEGSIHCDSNISLELSRQIRSNY